MACGCEGGDLLIPHQPKPACIEVPLFMTLPAGPFAVAASFSHLSLPSAQRDGFRSYLEAPERAKQQSVSQPGTKATGLQKEKPFEDRDVPRMPVALTNLLMELSKMTEKESTWPSGLASRVDSSVDH